MLQTFLRPFRNIYKKSTTHSSFLILMHHRAYNFRHDWINKKFSCIHLTCSLSSIDEEYYKRVHRLRALFQLFFYWPNWTTSSVKTNKKISSCEATKKINWNFFRKKFEALFNEIFNFKFPNFFFDFSSFIFVTQLKQKNFFNEFSLL